MSASEPTQTVPISPLLSLPPELLPHITSHLLYPDILSLRHSHPSFYYSSLLSTNTNVRLKVAWLLDRKERGLDCPDGKNRRWGRSARLSLTTDRDFCKRSADGEVSRIMEKRRRHLECKGGEGGCEVVRGDSCGGGRRRDVRRRWMAAMKFIDMEVSLAFAILAVGLVLWWVRTQGGLQVVTLLSSFVTAS
ncbi:MAG: hypothetical protein MMC33_007119 [Icmadophila ericetorum]|nr:hypothetical protein [Icmadophila ericetorum]